MAESSLPRELQLIIDDIVKQNVHLLEWEVFGNTTEDMRVVLTWRRIELTKEGNKSKWKLEGADSKKGKKSDKKKGGKSLDDDEDEDIQAYLEEREKKLNEKRSKEEQDKAKADAEKDANEKRIKEEKEANEKRIKEEKEANEKRIKDEKEANKKRIKEEKEANEKRIKKEKEANEKRIKEEKDANEKRIKEEGNKANADSEHAAKRNPTLKKGKSDQGVSLRKNKLTKNQKISDSQDTEVVDDVSEVNAGNKDMLMNGEKGEYEETEESRQAILLEEEKNRLNESRKLEDDEEEIDLNVKTPHTKEQATRMLHVQRSKFQMSIDHANLDEEQMKKIFPNGIFSSIYGEDWDPSRMPSDIQNWQYNGMPTEGKDGDINAFRIPGGGGDSDINSSHYTSDGKGMGTDLSMMYRGYDGKDMGTDLSGMYGGYYGIGPDIFGMYGSSGFVYNPKQMHTGYEYEYHGKVYQSKRVKKYKYKTRDRRPGRPVIRAISKCYNTKGWQGCVDCRYNDFCDKPTHKDEYMFMLFEDAKRPLDEELEDCKCNVCTGGAVHNGCFYRELLRLKSEYLIFDKYNYCFCSECIPFKYRRMCLRQELRLFRHEGSDHYYRLTTHDDDDGIVRNQLTWQQSDSLDSNYGSDEEESMVYGQYGFIQAILLDDIKMEITRDDKISFRDCPDCQCNGFCDNIRHKKLYQMLLHIDDEDFKVLQDECWCLVCEYKGAAHSGCAERELRRLKYDLLLFDVRNLCYCRECVPFKYRHTCLRQEMKMKRRNRAINLYGHL